MCLPGLYAVKVEQPGFRTTTIDNVQVIIDQAATVDAALAVGQVSEVVEVNAEGGTPLLDTVSNSLGGVIDNKRVEELPLNGRNFLQLALFGWRHTAVHHHQPDWSYFFDPRGNGKQPMADGLQHRWHIHPKPPYWKLILESLHFGD